MPTAAWIVERGMETWDENTDAVTFARLTGAYWLTGADVDGELPGGGCGVTKTGRRDRADHLGRARDLLARMEQSRMAIVAVSAVCVLAALLVASGSG
ncbi:hypothetical protein ACFC18_15435 [Streptomyces sp. NPDC056121]|uniref:hypothetical protein n=2 Tax=Streptomyces TaxID=1883 RepID=UPI001D0A37BF|nr:MULTISPECIES: hypothetical protein [Streptomyces]MCX5084128.1 hypothetical protein [Streptomyces sp. NBC_00401]UDM04545.1 hypothetical protein LGI35_42970 [Streptomyces longhuiensis]